MAPGPGLQALTSFTLDTVPARLTGGVVAIGNFDGMHRGHAVLIEQAREQAMQRSVPSLVLTFEPHPRTVLRPETPVFRLTPLAAKARILRALSVDGLAVAEFDRAFAETPPDRFIDAALVDALKATAVVVGFDFRFGKGRAGTPAVLAEIGGRSGFDVTVVDAVSDEAGMRFASSDVRDALAEGDVVRAAERLGYRWFVVGEVVAGDARGRVLGYPTANIPLPQDCGLRHGVYAVRVTRPGGTVFDGVASVGRRPMFDNGDALLEVFLFDFAGDLYGEELAVAFIAWLRPQEKFPTIPALVHAMDGNSARARAILANTGAGSPLDRALSALP